ncbi:hypothetical protein [Mycoplasma mycoides]|uniref:hypothetical protein n=2 Tax=Mycoplasma mycoides TaxID=2102 RepID=UPI00223F5380|nr:hypothetical protein [Mycoplasma mycoides]
MNDILGKNIMQNWVFPTKKDVMSMIWIIKKYNLSTYQDLLTTTKDLKNTYYYNVATNYPKLCNKLINKNNMKE